MATQLSRARNGEITEEIKQVAADEGYEPEYIREQVALGNIVIPKNNHRSFRAVGIGKGLRTKVNANIGASSLRNLEKEELKKLETAVLYGAESVMDLSTGGDLDEIRCKIIENSPVMIGTVPIYELATKYDYQEFNGELLFEVIEKQAKQGVDFITVHCGINKRTLTVMDSNPSPRIAGIVSRGGSLLAAYISSTGNENPLYEQFDRLCAICFEHDVTLSLGDGFRPGALADASDSGQIAELMVLGELTMRAREMGVQVMIEGPGHVPLDQIESNVVLEKRLCHGAPFYVLGPLVTDVAPGYDHITSAIGGAMAAAFGVDFLCYVTPAEHLRLPDVHDVREGVIASKIAAHAGDIVKKVPGAFEWDKAMSRARKKLDWEAMFSLAIDPVKARSYKMESEASSEDVCTMCGKLCAVRTDSERKKHK
ncbi:phosphomethylpyrimidine synthase ThiC [Myxococcota bacterium]|nr:phosphomethylpyrimidine synthase ThiC [Myxococcota bacterium]MBU1496745.1 phosphomethylpyrimidine synthase ThiC [Myxococcota bacterium]